MRVVPSTFSKHAHHQLQHLQAHLNSLDRSNSIKPETSDVDEPERCQKKVPGKLQLPSKAESYGDGWMPRWQTWPCKIGTEIPRYTDPTSLLQASMRCDKSCNLSSTSFTGSIALRISTSLNFRIISMVNRVCNRSARARSTPLDRVGWLNVRPTNASDRFIRPISSRSLLSSDRSSRL